MCSSWWITYIILSILYCFWEWFMPGWLCKLVDYTLQNQKETALLVVLLLFGNIPGTSAAFVVINPTIHSVHFGFTTQEITECCILSSCYCCSCNIPSYQRKRFWQIFAQFHPGLDATIVQTSTLTDERLFATVYALK